MPRRLSRPRAYDPDPAAPGRNCDMPDCAELGQYRAPKSRQNLRDYHWFCLGHVRAYNAAWDYYKDMSPAQIEAELRRDTTWQRPSWPLGRVGASSCWEASKDPLHVLSAGHARRAGSPRPGAEAPAELKEPLRTLGLAWPVTLDVVRDRYKQLAKANHPDATGGDPDATERFKTINLAYATVRSRLVGEPGLAHVG